MPIFAVFSVPRTVPLVPRPFRTMPMPPIFLSSPLLGVPTVQPPGVQGSILAIVFHQGIFLPYCLPSESHRTSTMTHLTQPTCLVAFLSPQIVIFPRPNRSTPFSVVISHRTPAMHVVFDITRIRLWRQRALVLLRMYDNWCSFPCLISPINRVISAGHLRPPTRRGFRPRNAALVVDIAYTPDLTHQGFHVRLEQNNIHRSTSTDPSNLIPSEQETNEPRAYDPPQTLASDIQHISHYPPVPVDINHTGPHMYYYDHRGSVSDESHVFPSESNTSTGRRQEDAGQLRGAPHAGSVRSTKRRRDPTLETIVVDVDPFTV